MFLQVSVILLTGVCPPQCMLGYNPPSQEQTPPGADTPPEQTPIPLGADTLGADTPRADPPPGKQTPAYGLRAASTHPTGMHSC